MKHDPLTADGQEVIADYTPIQLSPRRNGWTADRQRIFLCALAETGSISVACKAAGITARSAYRLRADPRGAPFAAAWHRALYIATNAMVALAFERATKGSYREYWKNGELVAEVRQPSDTMRKFLLTRLMPGMFNCRPQDNWSSAHYAQQHFPGLLDKLTDCDVRADALTSADFGPPPREPAPDPVIRPGEEDRSWQEEVDYGPERWGEPRHATPDFNDGPDCYPPASVAQRAAACLLSDLDEEEPDADFDEEDAYDDDLDDDDEDFDDDDLDDDDLDDDDLDDDDLDEDDEDFDDDALDEDDPDDDDPENPAADPAYDGQPRARTRRDRDSCDSSPVSPAGLTPRARIPRRCRSAGRNPNPGRSRAP